MVPVKNTEPSRAPNRSSKTAAWNNLRLRQMLRTEQPNLKEMHCSSPFPELKFAAITEFNGALLNAGNLRRLAGHIQILELAGDACRN